eukprot:931410_1
MHSFDQERKCCFEPATFFKMSLKMVDHRQNRKRSRHDNDDIDLTPDGDDGPPLKRIKLNPDDEDTCQELKLLSQTMNTIYNRSQHSSDPTFKFEDDLYKIQINEIIDALFLTHIMDLRYFTHADHRISSPFKKLLREFYGMHTVQFVEKWYTEQNIYSLYNGWKQYNVSCIKIINTICHAIDNAHGTRHEDHTIESVVQYKLTVIYKNERNKYMSSTDILAPVQLLIADGYIRHNADGLDIPQCISQAISIYYEPISLKCKIPLLLENEVDEMVMNMHTIEQNISEQLDRLAQVFPMLHDRDSTYESFYTVEWKAVEKIVRGLNDVWNQQYLLDEIGIMEYTKKIERFMEKSGDNYNLEQKAG